MILSQGAEAIIRIQDDSTLVKERISKSYRHPALDYSLRKARTKREANLILKAGKLVGVPKVELSKDKFLLKLEYLKGNKVRDFLLGNNLDMAKMSNVCEQIGASIAKLHENDIIHGDLTTSNMILVENGDNLGLFLIDFGLGKISYKLEDKAVDLQLLKKAFESKHFEIAEKCIEKILCAYEKSFQKKELHAQIMQRLKQVEKRGRKKH